MALAEALSSNSVVWKKENKVGRRFPETGRSQSNSAAQQTENKTQDGLGSKQWKSCATESRV